MQNLVSTDQKVIYWFRPFRSTNMNELALLLLNGFTKLILRKCIAFSMIDVVARRKDEKCME